MPRRGQQICLYGGENHDIIFSLPPHDYREHYKRKPPQFSTRGSPVVLDTSQIKQELTLSTKPVTLHAASAALLFRGQKGDPSREPPFLSSHSAGIVFPDQRVAVVLQHRLHPTMSRGYWCCRCCCCCCCCCYSYYCCYWHAAASCLCSSEPPVETLYRYQSGGWTPPSRRIIR